MTLKSVKSSENCLYSPLLHLRCGLLPLLHINDWPVSLINVSSGQSDAFSSCRVPALLALLGGRCLAASSFELRCREPITDEYSESSAQDAGPRSRPLDWNDQRGRCWGAGLISSSTQFESEPTSPVAASATKQQQEPLI